MLFNPKLSNIQSKALTKIKKLLNSEWLESVKLNSELTVQGIDVYEDNFKIHNKLVICISEDFVYDSKGNKYPLEEFLDGDITFINKMLDTYGVCQ